MNTTIEIGSIKPRIRFVATGENKSFDFSFRIFSINDLDVYINDILQDSGYVVTVSPNSIGGNITFNTPPAEGSIITINRNLDIKRTTDFSESKAFRSKMLNHEFDYQTACLEQLSDNLDRTMSFPPYSVDKTNATFPIPVAGSAIVWNNEGTALTNSKINMAEFDKIADQILEVKNTIYSDIELIKEASESIDDIQNKADADLSNTGLISNCILSAPNDFLNTQNNTINLKGKTSVLIPNGRNQNQSLNNIAYLCPNDQSFEHQNTSTKGEDIIFVSNDDTIFHTPQTNVYYSNSLPQNLNTTAYWFNPKDNLWRQTSDSGTSWQEKNIAPIGSYTYENGSVLAINPHSPASIVLSPNGYADVVIDSWQSGSSWYRKYKSGWIEQGGTNSGLNTNSSITINFLVACTPLEISLTRTNPANASMTNSQVQARDITKTSMLVQNGLNGGNGANLASINWKISGIIGA